MSARALGTLYLETVAEPPLGPVKDSEHTTVTPLFAGGVICHKIRQK